MPLEESGSTNAEQAGTGHYTYYRGISQFLESCALMVWVALAVLIPAAVVLFILAERESRLGETRVAKKKL